MAATGMALGLIKYDFPRFYPRGGRGVVLEATPPKDRRCHYEDDNMYVDTMNRRRGTKALMRPVLP